MAQDMPWRLAIATEAQKWVGKVGGIKQVAAGKWELHGWQTLIQIYKEGGETPTTIVSAWTPFIEQGIRAGKWIKKKPEGNDIFTDVEEEGVAWCGIFAAFVMKKAHYKVHWGRDRKLHAPTGDLTLEHPKQGAPSNWRDEIQMGDICVIGTNQHHVIVVDRQPGSPTVATVEGNIPFPERHAIVKKNQSVSNFHTWYRLSDL